MKENNIRNQHFAVHYILRQCIATRTEDWQKYRLGDAYSGLGKYEEALEKYDRALGLVVDNQSLIAISDLDKMTLADETISNVEKNHTDVKSTFKRDQIKEPDIDDLNAGDLQGAVTLDGLKVCLYYFKYLQQSW